MLPAQPQKKMQHKKHLLELMQDTANVNLLKNKEIKMLQYSEVVKTFVLNTIALPDEGLDFKIEILKTGEGRFYARLFRLETYRVKPSFVENILSDEAQYVLDYHTLPNLDEASHFSEKECLDSVIQQLHEKFG